MEESPRKLKNGCKTGYIEINNKQCLIKTEINSIKRVFAYFFAYLFNRKCPSLFSVGVNEHVDHRITLFAGGVAQS